MPREMSQATKIDAMPISDPFRGMSRPNAVISTAESSGRITTTQA
jgi:hypothetical protein